MNETNSQISLYLFKWRTPHDGPSFKDEKGEKMFERRQPMKEIPHTIHIFSQFFTVIKLVLLTYHSEIISKVREHCSFFVISFVLQGKKHSKSPYGIKLHKKKQKFSKTVISAFTGRENR